MRKILLVLLFVFVYLEVGYSAELSSIKFSGQVKKGEPFEKDIGGGLVFRLVPNELGWDISIGTKDILDDNFCSVVTPPYHGTNMIDIQGWHFRNSDNSGPNEPGPKNVNVPGEEREFLFVLNRPDFKTALDDLQKMLWSYSFTETQVKDAAIQHEKLRKGHGVLTAHDLKLNHLEPGQQAGIDAMKFDVEIFKGE